MDAAKACKARVRCFRMLTTREVAEHLNLVREAATKGETHRIPAIAYNTFNVRFYVCLLKSKKKIVLVEAL
jgi:hypothetical protein